MGEGWGRDGGGMGEGWGRDGGGMGEGWGRDGGGMGEGWGRDGGGMGEGWGSIWVPKASTGLVSIDLLQPAQGPCDPLFNLS